MPPYPCDGKHPYKLIFAHFPAQISYTIKSVYIKLK